MRIYRFVIIALLALAGPSAANIHGSANVGAYGGIGDPRYTCVTRLWVSNSGSDSNPGTFASPRLNIGSTDAIATPGTCVTVMPGTYFSVDHDITLGEMSVGGNADSLTGYVAIVCQVKWQCNLRPSLTSLSFNTLDLDGHHPNYIIIDGFDIQGGTWWEPQQSFEGNAIEDGFSHHHKLLNNRIHDSGFGGIQTTHMDYMLVQGNVIFNNALYATGANNESSGISFVIPAPSDALPGTHNFIRNNLVFGNGMGTFANATQQVHTDGNGIILDTWGDVVAYPYQIIIENNVVARNGHRGIEVLANACCTVDVIIRNNTVYKNDQDVFRSGTAGEMYMQAATTVQMYNNIIVSDTNVGTTGTINSTLTAVFPGLTLVSHNNLWWTGTPGQSGAQFFTVTDGVNGEVVGHAPVISAPSLNAAVANWHVTPGSPAVNAGSTAFGTTYSPDFCGGTRVVGGQIDIGACEGGVIQSWLQAGSPAFDLDFANQLFSGTGEIADNLLGSNPSLKTSTGLLPSSGINASVPGYQTATALRSAYATAYNAADTAGPGLLIEPAATNYFENSRKPQTQVVNGGSNVPAGQYCLWINAWNLGGTSTNGRATLSGCATGVAFQGIPVRFTLAAPAACTVTIAGGVFAAQFENTQNCTSYIPTTVGATASRDADYILTQGTALATSIGSTASLYTAWGPSSGVSGNINMLTGDVSSPAFVPFATPSTVTATAPTSLSATYGSGSVLSTISKVASAWNPSGRALVANNGTVVTDANAPGTNTGMALGDTEASSGAEFNGQSTRFTGYPTLLSNGALQALTVVSLPVLCPQGSSLPDGCSGAQASGITPYPNLMTSGVLQAIAIRTGSGFTNGTYSWTSTGGGCAVLPSGTVTVTGGNIGGPAGLAYIIANPGAGCTSRPIIAIPAGAGAGSNGSMTAVLYTDTPHTLTTKYNVPGVDYPVGYDRTLTLLDPTVSGNLPVGATVSGTTVTIGSNNVTLNGFDFCAHSASLTISASVTGYVVTNNRFCNPVANGQNITLGSSTSGIMEFNDFNGGAPLGGNGSAAALACGSNCGPNGALCCGGPTSLTFEYNYCYQQDSKCFQVNGGGTVIEKYNVYDTMGNCASGGSSPCAHGEAEYSFGSGTITGWQISYNLYWNPFHCTQQGGDTAGCPNGNPGNLTSISALQADTLSINGTTFDHNVILMPGPNAGCASGATFAYTGSAAVFDGAQGGGTITNVAETANILDSSADFNTWYHASLGSGVTTTNNITAVGGGACN